MQPPIEMIERDFIARRLQPPDMAGTFVTALGHCGVDPDRPVLRRLVALGGAVAAAIDALAVPGPEPAYHNRHHMIDATLAMGMLCGQARAQGLLTGMQAAIGVTAMLGHDLGHDGSMASAGVLEGRSRDAVLGLARAVGLGRVAKGVLDDVIMATDVTRYADNAARFAAPGLHGPRARGQDALRALANEADIFASVLPRLGPKLSRALAAEWRATGNPALGVVGTASSRLAFLLGLPPFSAPAVAIGLHTARARCLDAYAAAGRGLGADGSAEAGCTALDRLDPAVAAAVYAQAVG